MNEQTRCRAGARCGEGESVHDELGEFAGKQGALIHDPAKLCDSCTREVGYALSQLPGAHAELSSLLEPSLLPQFSDPDMPSQPHVMCHPGLPIRTDVLALQELIDYEIYTWARSVADEHDLRWSALDMARSRTFVRIGQGARLLRNNLDQFLALGSQEHRARSLTSRRADGHDPDTTTRFGDDYWVNRDGADGGLVLIALHNKAQRYAARHPGERVLTPCVMCERRALVRDHRTGLVRCEACHRDFTDDDHEDILAAAYAAYGIEAP